MSEEVLSAAADLTLVERLTRERDALQLQLDATRADLATIEAAHEQRAVESFRLGQRLHTAERQRDAYRADRDLSVARATSWKRAAKRNRQQFRRVLRLWSSLLMSNTVYRELLREVYAQRVGYLAPDLLGRIRDVLQDAPVASRDDSGVADDEVLRAR